jgi:hypothetical protein
LRLNSREAKCPQLIRKWINLPFTTSKTQIAMIKKLFSAAALLAMPLLLGCEGETVCCDPVIADVPKGKLFLSVKADGDYLPDVVLSKLKLCYYEQGTYKVTTPIRPEDSRKKPIPGLLFSSEISEKIKLLDLKEIYLDNRAGDVDTLSVTVEKVTDAQSLQERCRCSYPIRSIRYRGEQLKEDLAINPDQALTPVYLLDK